MKNKFKGILVGLICLFMFPLFVFADIGMPSTVEYDVRVNNKDGAIVYNYDGKATDQVLPYDAKLTVIYEYTSQSKQKFASVRYNNETYEIKLEDVVVFSKDVDLDNFYKSEKTKKLYVFDENCYLYAGPSTLYGHVDGDVKVPVGTILEYQYSDDLWAYTEYNGVKGWVYHYTLVPTHFDDIKSSVATVAENGSKLYVVNKIDSLLKSPYSEEKVDVEIPVGEEIEYDYYISYPKRYAVHVKVDNKEGWLEVVPSNFYSDTKGGAFLNDCSSLYIYADKGATIYKKAGDLSSATSDKIPYGEIISVKYDYVSDYYAWYKVVYKDKEVWINEKLDMSNNLPVTYLRNYGTADVYKISKDLEVYEKADTSKKTDKTIKSGTTIEVLFTTYSKNQSWGYVDIDGTKGWVSLNGLDRSDSSEFCISHLRVESFEEKDSETKKEQNEEDSKGLTKKEIIIYSVGGAVVLALVAIVSITIVNKKKNKGI